jgi:glycosyltransferase involved in cell wall biosynthesis
VTDVPRHLAEADVFVLASYGEGMANALLEAMAAGLPCITTDTPGNNTLIQHERNGLLVQHNDDAAELARASALLARSAPLRERLGREARRTVAEAYDIRLTARRYAALYQRLVDCPEAAASARAMPG